MKSSPLPLPMLSFLWCVGIVVTAQGPASPAFEVASVKQNRSGNAATELGFQAGGRFRATNETLWRLIGEAYAGPSPLPRFRILGGPNWIDSDRFDVAATAHGEPTQDDRRAMLRRLLADRFRLVAHTETRELPLFELVLSRSDQRLGPQLRRSEIDCATGRGGKSPQVAQAPGELSHCMMGFGFGRLTATGMTVTQLAELGLSRYVDRPVVNQTGLRGPFDWSLVWTPDNLPQRSPGTPLDQPLVVNGLAIDPNGPPLSTALQEQLGLKLVSGKGPVEVVVIDHVEHPREN